MFAREVQLTQAQETIYNSSEVIVRDLGVNCIIARAWRSTERLAALFYDDNLRDHATTEKERLEQAIMTLWRGDRSMFVSQQKLQRTDEWIDIEKRTVQSLLPLLLETLDFNMYSSLMSDLNNSSLFNTTLPVPSTPPSEKEFLPDAPHDISWRGNSY